MSAKDTDPAMQRLLLQHEQVGHKDKPNGTTSTIDESSHPQKKMPSSELSSAKSGIESSSIGSASFDSDRTRYPELAQYNVDTTLEEISRYVPQFRICALSDTVKAYFKDIGVETAGESFLMNLDILSLMVVSKAWELVEMSSELESYRIVFENLEAAMRIIATTEFEEWYL